MHKGKKHAKIKYINRIVMLLSGLQSIKIETQSKERELLSKLEKYFY